MCRRLFRGISLLFIAALIPSVFATRPAFGQDPLSLSLTNKLDYRRLDQDDVREEAFRNRTELTAFQGIFSVWLRLEALQISDVNVYDPFLALDQGDEDGRVDQMDITKRTITVETDRFRGDYGDVSYVFGRGMLPSVFEDEELNFDTRLEGLTALYDHDYVTGSMLAGSNEENRLRAIYAEPVAWRDIRVGGGFAEAWGSGEETEIREREQHLGAYADLSTGPVSLYGEYVHREFPKTGDFGYGAFFAAIASVGGVTLSGEYKDFDTFEHDYHDPPTTLRQHTWTLLNRESGQVLADITDDDVRGVLAEGEYSPGLFTTFVASFSKLDRRETPDRFWEAFGEAKGTWQEQVFVTAGAAESELEVGNLFEERITGVGEIVGQLDDSNSLTFGVEWAEVQESNTATEDFEFPVKFRERIFYLSYGRSPWLNLTVSYENSGDPAESREDWTTVAAEIGLAADHDLLISYGAERGGWKCTGGICFFEPEFEGFKLRWVARF
jgi:hypothetical protein